MKNRAWNFVCLLLVGCLALVLAGCGQQTEVQPLHLADVENRQFVHEHNGLALTIPTAWQTISSDDNSVTFANEEGTLSLLAKWELGGFSYFSQTELEQIATEIAEAELVEPEVLAMNVYDGLKNAVRVIAKGQLPSLEKDGETVNGIVDVLVISPLSGVRYYLVVTAGVEQYQQNAGLLEEVYNSFYVSKKEDDLYKMLADRPAPEQQQATPGANQQAE